MKREGKRTIYIYGLFDPRRPKILFYVGKGTAPCKRCGATYQRARWQISCFRRGKPIGNKFLLSWFRKLRSQKVEASWKIIEIVSISTWKARERYWIAFWRKKNPALCNIGNGGEDFGPSGRANALKPGYMRRIGLISRHVRLCVNRGIKNPNCKFCKKEK
jgi:hypothetical protein